MKRIITTLTISLLVVCGVYSQGGDQLVNEKHVRDQSIPNKGQRDNWELLFEEGPIKIETKVGTIAPNRHGEQSVVLYRYINSSDARMELNFRKKIYRNGECTNCKRLDDDENLTTVVVEGNSTLEPEIVKGKNLDKSFYVFSHYLKQVPGMTGKKVSKIEIIEFTSKELNDK